VSKNLSQLKSTFLNFAALQVTHLKIKKGALETVSRSISEDLMVPYQRVKLTIITRLIFFILQMEFFQNSLLNN
jgi:hypothetical protein